MKSLKSSRLSSTKLSRYDSSELQELDSIMPINVKDLINNPPKTISVQTSANQMGSEDEIRSKLIAQALMNKL